VVAVTQESVAAFRELADPDRYRPALAEALSILGLSLLQLSQAADAAAVAQESVAIRRELANADPDRYRGDLARPWETSQPYSQDWAGRSTRCPLPRNP